MATGHGYTVEEINKAVARTAKALNQLPEGAGSAPMIHFLTELYLGAIDADKEDYQKAQVASN